MKHLRATSLVLLLMGVIAAATADAVAPQFHAADSTVNNTGALVVNWDERGLGNDDVNYTVTASATAVYACINRGGNHPQATNKQTVSLEVTASASFEPKNGRVVAGIIAGPPSAGSFSCPSGQALVLASVAYTTVMLTDTTNNVFTAVPDASRTFFEV